MLLTNFSFGKKKKRILYNTLSPFLPKFEALISCLILQIKFSKKMCLEHDQRLISYLSMLRDIEMRIKRVQPAEQNLAALHDLRQQAEVSEAGPGLAGVRQSFPFPLPSLLWEIHLRFYQAFITNLIPPADPSPFSSLPRQQPELG